jgi:hypothetical protein
VRVKRLEVWIVVVAGRRRKAMVAMTDIGVKDKGDSGSGDCVSLIDGGCRD